MECYRLSWEMVPSERRLAFCEIDKTPGQDAKLCQSVPNDHVPDEYWVRASWSTATPWDRYQKLVRWDNENTHFVRKVKLEVILPDAEHAREGHPSAS